MTVVFTLCNPDVAFLSKMAFSVFGINDSDYLITHAAAGDLKDGMNGTGPLKLDQWQRGTEIDYSRFDGYWGDPAVTGTAVLNWLDPATRLNELINGTIDGYTNAAAAEYDAISANSDLQLVPGGGLNTLYLGFNHDYAPWDNLAVRQALAIGIDRQRIVDTFMPDGSEVASHFTPCTIAFGCEGDPWPDTDVATARQMITDAVGEAGITTTLAWRNPPIRGYLPQPDETATDFQAQLEAINIHVTLDKQESGTYIANANTGQLTGLFLLGWGADYPDVTNFLDYHFGTACTSAFGACYPEIYDHLTVGSQTAVEADRAAAYTEANNAIREQVPMVPISHAGFAHAYKAGLDVAQASPLSNELLFRMLPADDSETVVFSQNSEPIGLYCADETDGESLRACEQSMEGLYGFAINGVLPEPLLATSCDPSEDLSVWTCHLRPDVTFHDGATFEAVDVLASFAAQWDNLSALHVGNTGVFEYWGGLWAGNLNPSAPCGIPDQPACE
jgi:ABC-type transport system substrate-binding protein